MSTYQKPKAKGPVYRFQAVGWDRFDKRVYTPADGTLVRKTHPGCGAPKNGTFGHCYVEDARSGQFYGLVLVNSLQHVPAREACKLLTAPEVPAPPPPETGCVEYVVFKVVSVSSTVNAFGLRGYILVAKSGEAWEVGRSDCHKWERGELVQAAQTRIKNAAGQVIRRTDPYFEGCEIPRRLPNADAAVLAKIFK